MSIISKRLSVVPHYLSNYLCLVDYPSASFVCYLYLEVIFVVGVLCLCLIFACVSRLAISDYAVSGKYVSYCKFRLDKLDCKIYALFLSIISKRLSVVPYYLSVYNCFIDDNAKLNFSFDAVLIFYNNLIFAAILNRNDFESVASCALNKLAFKIPLIFKFACFISYNLKGMSLLAVNSLQFIAFFAVYVSRNFKFGYGIESDISGRHSGYSIAVLVNPEQNFFVARSKTLYVSADRKESCSYSFATHNVLYLIDVLCVDAKSKVYCVLSII